MCALKLYDLRTSTQDVLIFSLKKVYDKKSDLLHLKEFQLAFRYLNLFLLKHTKDTFAVIRMIANGLKDLMRTNGVL